MIGRDVLKAFVLVGLTASLCAGSILQDLGPKLSPQAWITTNNSTAVRWSDYHPPTAGYYVHVAEEADVATTVSIENQIVNANADRLTHLRLKDRKSVV